MERAEGADEGPERSQARTKQRKQAKGAIMIGLSTTRTSIYGGHMMWLCNGWRRGPEARYSNGTVSIFTTFSKIAIFSIFAIAYLLTCSIITIYDPTVFLSIPIILRISLSFFPFWFIPFYYINHSHSTCNSS